MPSRPITFLRSGARQSRALALATLTATLGAALLTAACTGSRPEIRPAAATSLPPVALVDERTRRPLGASPGGALNASAANARAGTLIARSPDDRVCVFADGRGGWNRAAC